MKQSAENDVVDWNEQKLYNVSDASHDSESQCA
jgi:hypothetical protein